MKAKIGGVAIILIAFVSVAVAGSAEVVTNNDTVRWLVVLSGACLALWGVALVAE